MTTEWKEMTKGKVDNTKLLIILIGSVVLVGVIGIVLIAIFAPASQSTALMSIVTAFIALIIPVIFNLVKTQAVIDASAELSKQLKFEGEEILSRSHRHKEVLLKGIEETKAVAIEAKEASKKAEHVANDVNIKIKSLGIARNDLQRRDVELRERQDDRQNKEIEKDDE